MPSSVKQVLQASHIIKIHASNGAYAALCNQGSVQGAVVTWGRSNIDGGTIPAHLLDALSSDVVDINTIQAFPSPQTASLAAFIAGKKDNKHVSWGSHLKQEEFDPERD